MSHFINDGKQTSPYVFIQWKGTDVCMDFYCKCGAQGHFDGYFAHAVKCQHCGTIYEMPCYLSPREIDKKTQPGYVTNAKLLEPDEDYSTEATDAEGVTHLVPHPVNDAKEE